MTIENIRDNFTVLKVEETGKEGIQAFYARKPKGERVWMGNIVFGVVRNLQYIGCGWDDKKKQIVF